MGEVIKGPWDKKREKTKTAESYNIIVGYQEYYVKKLDNSIKEHEHDSNIDLSMSRMLREELIAARLKVEDSKKAYEEYSATRVKYGLDEKESVLRDAYLKEILKLKELFKRAHAL